MDETTVAFWLGSYTPTADGTGTETGVGVRGLGRDASGGLVPVTERTADSPSWVVQHPALPVVYAAEEFTGFVKPFRAAHDGTLVALGAPVEVGGIVCHLTVSPDGRTLLATCYGRSRRRPPARSRRSPLRTRDEPGRRSGPLASVGRRAE
jgi:6-phosphogluconolactonase